MTKPRNRDKEKQIRDKYNAMKSTIRKGDMSLELYSETDQKFYNDEKSRREIKNKRDSMKKKAQK